MPMWDKEDVPTRDGWLLSRKGLRAFSGVGAIRWDLSVQDKYGEEGIGRKGPPNVRHQILGRGDQGMPLGMMGERLVIYIYLCTC